jgi:1-acyl-sn-glycerol-3-phosphate acyltransferase
MPLLYRICKFIVKNPLLFLTRPQIKNRGNAMLPGPFIIVANHLSWSDPVLLALIFSQHIAFMGKDELFRSPFLRYLLEYGVGAIPVHRGRFDRKALRQANEVLGERGLLGIFPEGSRSRDMQLQHGLPGAALLALRSGVPILPVGITGTKQIRGIAWLIHRPQITINIGQPFRLPQPDGKLTSNRLASLTDFIMKQIAKLLPEDHRGIYRTGVREEISLVSRG